MCLRTLDFQRASWAYSTPGECSRFSFLYFVLLSEWIVVQLLQLLHFPTENPNPTRGDFSACTGFDEEACAWTGLWVRFQKHCPVCLRTLDLQRAAWAYRTLVSAHDFRSLYFVLLSEWIVVELQLLLYFQPNLTPCEDC